MYTINGNTMTGDQLFQLALIEQERAEAAEQCAAQLEAERDDAQSDLRKVYAYIVQDTATRRELLSTIETLIKENRVLEAKLEAAQAACVYWLADGRFLVANTKEHEDAVKMLASVVNTALTDDGTTNAARAGSVGCAFCSVEAAS